MAYAPPKSRADIQRQRAALVNSYNELLTEFSSPELQTVGNYTLVEQVARGTFGKVYLGCHRLTSGTRVVLKAASKYDANLAREIHHHRQMIHPNIVQLYEVIVTETQVWLVLEYCPLKELYSFLVHHGRLSVEKTQKMFAQLCGAVAYVHKMNCVHRDLKLENILLDKNENIKLADFGFTREYEQNKLLETFCGTICYSAPEMLKGEKYVPYTVDVWSLGVILYTLLVGQMPFDEDEEEQTKTKILEGEPEWPEHLPEDALDLLKKMLNKKPLERPKLDDILSHPFLGEHGATQKAVMNRQLQRRPLFTTQLEQDVLSRLRAAYVDTDALQESVRSQKCDALHGWWWILYTKERRRHRSWKKKIESRRVSAASNYDPQLYPAPKEEMEDLERLRKAEREKERKEKEAAAAAEANGTALAVVSAKSETSSMPHSPKSGADMSVPAVPPKDDQQFSPYLKPPTLDRKALSTPDLPRRPTRKQLLIAQLTSIKHWFLDSAKRAVPAAHPKSSPPSKEAQSVKSAKDSHNADPSKHIFASYRTELKSSGKDSTKGKQSNGSAKSPPKQKSAQSHPPPRRPSYTRTGSNTSNYSHRNSLTPVPTTPRTTRRAHRLSAGSFNGRNSTSSSISSIRSFHKSHSKASSTSSTSSLNLALKTPRSPRSSIKVLPATPTQSKSRATSAASTPGTCTPIAGAPSGSGYHPFGPGWGTGTGRDKPLPSHPHKMGYSVAAGLASSFPAGAGVAGGGGVSRFDEAVPGSLTFAKRKKTPFRGPALGIGIPRLGGKRKDGGGGQISGSAPAGGGGFGGAAGGFAIQEEEEEEDEEEDRGNEDVVVVVVGDEDAQNDGTDGEWVEEEAITTDDAESEAESVETIGASSSGRALERERTR